MSAKSGTRDETYHITDPIIIAFFLPKISERKPEIKAPRNEPPAMEAVIPPCTLAFGPVQSEGSAGVLPWLK